MLDIFKANVKILKMTLWDLKNWLEINKKLE